MWRSLYEESGWPCELKKPAKRRMAGGKRQKTFRVKGGEVFRLENKKKPKVEKYHTRRVHQGGAKE